MALYTAVNISIRAKSVGASVFLNAVDRILAYAQRAWSEHLRRERSARRGLCRAAGVSLT